MNKIEVVRRFPETGETAQTEANISGLSFLTDGMDTLVGKPIKLEGTVTSQPEEKKRGRPKKKESVQMYRGESDRKLNMMESKDPYIKTYESTNTKLEATIKDIDDLALQIGNDLRAVRANKTMKKKYDYICELAGTAGALVSNRISAIKELNASITNAHKLEMSRAKQVKELNDGKDDDKTVMDMYNAFVHAPMGSQQSLPSGFNVPSTILNGSQGMPIMQNGMTEEQMYQNFINNPSPEMSAITLENNPNIQIVVVYNQETQEKYFDVVDITTGQSVKGVERPTDQLLNRMDINLREGVARNIDANLEYKLVIVGNRRIDEY